MLHPRVRLRERTRYAKFSTFRTGQTVHAPLYNRSRASIDRGFGYVSQGRTHGSRVRAFARGLVDAPGVTTPGTSLQTSNFTRVCRDWRTGAVRAASNQNVPRAFGVERDQRKRLDSQGVTPAFAHHTASIGTRSHAPRAYVQRKRYLRARANGAGSGRKTVERSFAPGLLRFGWTSRTRPSGTVPDRRR